MLSKGEGIPKCREALSADDTATVNQDDVGDDLDLEYEVTRDEFEGVVSSVVEQLDQLCLKVSERLQNEFGIKKDDIFRVELLGDCTRTPIFQEKIKANFCGRKAQSTSRTLHSKSFMAIGGVVVAASEIEDISVLPNHRCVNGKEEALEDDTNLQPLIAQERKYAINDLRINKTTEMNYQLELYCNQILSGDVKNKKLTDQAREAQKLAKNGDLVSQYNKLVSVMSLDAREFVGLSRAKSAEIKAAYDNADNYIFNFTCENDDNDIDDEPDLGTKIDLASVPLRLYSPSPQPEQAVDVAGLKTELISAYETIS